MAIDFSFLIKGILILTCLVTFLFWYNMMLIGWKDRDKYLNIQRVFLPHEKKMVRGYWKKMIITVVIGIIIVVIAYQLHFAGILLPGPKK